MWGHVTSSDQVKMLNDWTEEENDFFFKILNNQKEKLATIWAKIDQY